MIHFLNAASWEAVRNFRPSVDELESALAQQPQVECPVNHFFVPGMYIRETHVPAGVMLTSVQHRFEHPFVLLKGRIRVVSETEGSVIYQGPKFGITPAGTRRGVFVEEDCVMITFHATEETDVEKIGEQITIPHDNPLMESGILPQWQHQLTNQ